MNTEARGREADAFRDLIVARSGSAGADPELALGTG